MHPVGVNRLVEPGDLPLGLNALVFDALRASAGGNFVRVNLRHIDDFYRWSLGRRFNDDKQGFGGFVVRIRLCCEHGRRRISRGRFGLNQTLTQQFTHRRINRQR
ncbi:hypothetical protein [Denitromonas ohlonensis]|uniref:hypothetical protein n=1 Tax=Denitromonas ohlonensis TaxID=3078508 RepID=UPI0016434C02|nr:hypothetical protein [Denitromonas ohlonensis]